MSRRDPYEYATRSPRGKITEWPKRETARRLAIGGGPRWQLLRRLPGEEWEPRSPW